MEWWASGDRARDLSRDNHALTSHLVVLARDQPGDRVVARRGRAAEVDDLAVDRQQRRPVRRVGGEEVVEVAVLLAEAVRRVRRRQVHRTVLELRLGGGGGEREGWRGG